VVEATDATFDDEVLKATLPVLVDFWAEWCGPCKMVAPVVDEIARDYDGRLKVVKFDVDANPVTPSGLGIMGIPTLILFKEGEEAARLVGYRSKEALEETILPLLS